VPPDKPSSEALVVRRSTPDDVESFWHCLDSVARERRFLAFVHAPPLEQARAFLEDGRSRGMVQFVAVARPRVVGWCDVIPKPYEGFQHSGTLGMGLLPGYRRRGLGSSLLAHTLQASREQGLTRIELEVLSSNESAIYIYLRSGFVREGLKRSARILDGQVEDIICMALQLAPR
jgi:ribosomal protein S18 acetylase RimI-like enzyme